MNNKNSCRRLSFYALILFSFFLISSFSQSAVADGKNYPERAYKVPPNIPSQKALIVYKDGIEKLTIESTLDGQGKEFGWIIPLPAVPTEFEQASPGLIKTLSLVAQPEITHDFSEGLKLLYFLLFLIILWFLINLIFKIKHPAVSLLVIVIVGFFLFGFLMPAYKNASLSMGGGGYTGVQGVSVKDAQQIGSFDLAVLDANTPGVLDKWLEINSFLGLDRQDTQIVSEYIDDGWCFVAAKLKRDSEGGLSRPHPLSMTFTAEKPVYPMKLTSTVGNELYLELYVISDELSKASNLKLEFSDKYSYDEEAKYIDNHFRESKYLPGYVSANYGYGYEIGHPEQIKMMWDGCVVSKLCGSLSPEQMREDIYIKQSSSSPYRARYWSHRGAREAAIMVSISLFILLIVILTFFFHDKNRDLWPDRALIKILLSVTIFPLTLFTIVYLAIPKVETETGNFLYYRYNGMDIFLDATDEIQDKGLNLLEFDAEGLEKFIQEFFDFRISKNRITGGRVLNEDSPGNYTILKGQRGFIFRAYDRGGFPVDYIIENPVEAYTKVLSDATSEYKKLRSAGELARLRNSSNDGGLMKAIASLEKIDAKIAVKAMIDNIEMFMAKREYYFDYTLSRLTGYNITSADCYPQNDIILSGNTNREKTREETIDCLSGKWRSWWEENKDKTRIQWLQNELANASQRDKLKFALEIASLGDDSALDILLNEFNSTDKPFPFVALGLVKLDKEEGLTFFIKYLDELDALGDTEKRRDIFRALSDINNDLVNKWLLEELKKDPDRYDFVVRKLEYRCPEQIAPFVLKHLAMLRSGAKLSSNEWFDVKGAIEKDVNRLARMLWIIPPLDVKNNKAMDEFVQKIELLSVSKQ